MSAAEPEHRAKLREKYDNVFRFCCVLAAHHEREQLAAAEAAGLSRAAAAYYARQEAHDWIVRKLDDVAVTLAVEIEEKGGAMDELLQ